MTNKRPASLGGIMTLADLDRRCRDGDGGCRLYLGSRSDVYLAEEGRVTSLGAAVGWLATGKRPPDGKMWVALCGDPRCISHRALRAAGEQTRIAAAGGRLGGLVHAMHVAQGRRSMSRITDEQCAEIRAETGPLAAGAQKWGISVSHYQRIRAGGSRRPLGSAGMFAQLLGSAK